MSKISDDQLASWTKPAFGNEEEKALNTEQTIREAIQAHPVLKDLKIRVFAKGSFKNNTNVRRDSDIDIAVELQDLIQLEFMDGLSLRDTNLSPYSGIDTFSYKKAVGEAISSAFGSNAVDSSGNKVFVVRESSLNLAADVIPCTTYRRYYNWGFRQGIQLILNNPDGKRHYNYPDQHYENGINKNITTSKRFKRAVRIMKNIEHILCHEGKVSKIPSYFIECLAYNISDPIYLDDNSWREIVSNICAKIYGYAKNPEPDSEKWKEVNGYKHLFHTDQTWQREDALNLALLVYDKLN